MTGAVRTCVHRESRQKFAVSAHRDGPHLTRRLHGKIKTINKNRLKPASLARMRIEIEILQEMDHPNIVRMHEEYSTLSATCTHHHTTVPGI